MQANSEHFGSVVCNGFPPDWLLCRNFDHYRLFNSVCNPLTGILRDCYSCFTKNLKRFTVESNDYVIFVFKDGSVAIISNEIKSSKQYC